MNATYSSTTVHFQNKVKPPNVVHASTSNLPTTSWSLRHKPQALTKLVATSTYTWCSLHVFRVYSYVRDTRTYGTVVFQRETRPQSFLSYNTLSSPPPHPFFFGVFPPAISFLPIVYVEFPSSNTVSCYHRVFAWSTPPPFLSLDRPCRKRARRSRL